MHCTEGKDRCGIASAVLECFMGASYDEVVADYLVTYYNYYGIQPGTEKAANIAKYGIVSALQTMFGVEDLSKADLQAEALDYLLEIGLNAAINLITKALADQEKVQIVGFGSFEVVNRAARTARNPRTGEAVEIAASKAPAFKAGKALKDSVNK